MRAEQSDPGSHDEQIVPNRPSARRSWVARIGPCGSGVGAPFGRTIDRMNAAILASSGAETGGRTVEMIGLRDGRQLGYEVFGDPSGRPVLFFHGSPGSRLGAGLVASAARGSRAMLVGVDRPGMGCSDLHPGRRLTDRPDDVVRLLDHLELRQVAVLGVSAGAAYVYACCQALPERVATAAVISGVGPPWALTGLRPAAMRFVVRRMPALGRAMFSGIAERARRDPGRFFPLGCGPADRRALEGPGIRAACTARPRASTQGGFRQASAGPGSMHAARSFTRPLLKLQTDVTSRARPHTRLRRHKWLRPDGLAGSMPDTARLLAL